LFNVLKFSAMKNFFNRITPKTSLNKVNLALTGVFLVLLAGNIYLRSTTPPPGPEPNCPEFGETFFPHPEAGNWFFHCIDGVPFLKKCPAGTAWNPELDSCFPDPCYWNPTGICGWGIQVTPGGNSTIWKHRHSNWGYGK